MKGVSNIVTAVILVLATIAIATIVSGWALSLTQRRSDVIENQTEQKLNCVYASMYIYNASYQGNCNCSSGVHNLSITIRNTGGLGMNFNKAYIATTTGDTYEFDFNSTTVDVGSIATLVNSTTSGASYDCTPFNETSKIAHIKITSLTCPYTDELDGSDVVMDKC